MKIKKSASILRNLTTRYAIALILIAVLITTSSLTLEVLISEQESASAVINISGRQRMLSQRIALYSFALISSPKPWEQERLRSKLSAAIELMDKSHQGLINGDSDLGLPGGVSPKISSLYYDQPVALNAKLQSYLASARALASLPDSQLASNQLGLDVYLERHSESILTALDQVVKQHQIEMEEAVEKLSRLEMMVWIFTIFLLGIEVLVIFRPMAHKVVRQVDLLAKQKETLSRKFRLLKETRDQLIESEKIASLGRMVAGFSHEINTPIGIAISAVSQSQESVRQINHQLQLEEVDEKVLLDELDTLDQASQLAFSNLNRAARLVTSFKRTSVDQQTEADREFDLRELTEDIVFTLNSRLKKQRVTVAIDCPSLLTLEGKPGHIEQLLTNLIVNSLVHGYDDQGGVIKIGWSIDKDQEIRLEYQDDGKGIAKDSIAGIFEPFYTTCRADGTGLGLYICHSIVSNDLKGQISCRSELGKGAEFTAVFPMEGQPV